MTETESNTLDVDMATAVTNLTQAETTQQALVKAGADMSQVNLFDYLPTS